MAISSTANRSSTAGDGSATAFTFPYLFFAADDLKVILVVDSTGVETTKTLTTHYTVTGAGVAAGGTVTMGSAPASGETLVIIREEQFTQGLDLVENDPFPSDLVEQQLDTLTMLAQQVNTEVGRAVRLSDGDTTGADTTLATPVANAYLLWDSTGLSLTSSIDSAGQYLGSNGTVSLPFYSFSSDPDSGFYRIGANNIGLTLNGAKVVDYNTSGMNGAIGATTAATGAFTTLAASGTGAITGVLTMGGDVVSDTDSTDSLGTTGVRWLKAWVDSIQTTADVDVGANLTIAGNLTVNGTTVTNDATNTVIKDPLIELNSGAGSNANDLGLIMERGSTGNNAVILWDESGDFFTVGTTTATADATGNMTYAFAPFKCSTLTATAGTLAGLTSIAMSAGATLTAGFLDEDAMGSNSAVAGVTQQSVKAYVDNNAPENGVKFAFESTTTDADQGVGKVWLNHSTPSSATVLYIDDVEAGSVSGNAWVDTWDDVTNDVARGMIYIASYGATNAILVYKVTGAVTSASTYSKVAVTHVLTVGTISDGDVIGLTFIPSGANGEDGDGSGDIVGPGSATDNALARYNSTTGKLLQNSGVTADDSGNIAANNLSGSNTGDESAASATASGIVELATDAETITGTDTARAVTPANIQAKVASTTAKGIVELATNAEAVTGSDTARAVTPAGVAAAIAGTASGPSTVALTALAMVYSATDANINGTVGVYYLADDFETDSLATKTNAQYVSTFKGSYITYSTIASLNPVLSSYTGTLATGGSITVSANVERTGAYYAWKAFDNNYATTWSTYTSVSANGEVAWLKMVYGEAQVITKITMGKNSNDVHYLPASFTFEGSNDGSAWTNLLTRTDVVSADYAQNAQTSFDLTYTGSFTQYRLSTSDSIGSSYIDIGKFECFGYTSNENITLAPTAVTIASANPSDLVAYLVINPQESITAGTDIIFKGSIDGGSTKATGTWTKIVDLGITANTQKELWKVDIDVDSQTGSSLSYEITTANTKKIQVCDIIGIIPT